LASDSSNYLSNKVYSIKYILLSIVDGVGEEEWDIGTSGQKYDPYAEELPQ